MNDRSAQGFAPSARKFALLNDFSADFAKLVRSLFQLARKFQAEVPTTCRRQRGRSETELGSARLAPTACGYF
ncbi:hypothetical protein [Geomicrobium sp. JCM 19037]|uniref:hypothetical protein n=1 Tax=Geomicrobium sp. JCM 19037 TaxID=1460634 RepID=UPI0005A9E9DE|nr:hypothetical protein [Geomicrobium sp. JCM 19037]